MKKFTLISIILVFAFANNAVSQRVMENLNRGLVAVRTSTSQVFLSWRVFGSDPSNVAFNLYRGDVKINATPISGATNYVDNNSAASVYKVKTVLNNVETGEEHSATIWANNYLEIPLLRPDAMTMPDNTTCTYSPSDCSTGDVDGDGEYEIIVKWEPSNAKDNSQSGYTGNVYIDTYKLNGTRLNRIDLGKNIRAGAHYTQFMVADFDGDGKAEIACKTAPGTKDGSGAFISKGPAATTNHAADYRNSGGYILDGPEYFTVFSGLTGAELATANYNPPRGTVSSWGDSYGNRVDRFLAGVAYLDGVLPSIIMCRGYYTRSVIAAWDYRNGTLTNRWTYDSGNSWGNNNLYGQGNHNMSVADVDDDGKDEIIWGSGAVNDDGKFMYTTGLGHGDAMHLSDLDPDRKGLELWQIHENTNSAYGHEMHDARTGAIIWGTFTGSDNGRGIAANIIPGNRGFEMWSSSVAGVHSKDGTMLSTSKPSMNFRIYWDGDLQDELLDGTTVTKYGGGALLSATGCSSNNGTKSTPNLSADILGDWREEVIFRTTDNTKLRIFTTTTPTTHKMYTLMHDAVYRNSIAWQNTAYNQPPHAGFYIGDDMDGIPVSDVYNKEKRWKSGSAWDNNTSASWKDHANQTATFQNGDGVVFDISAGANATVAVTGQLTPLSVKVNSPYNVEITGTGSLNGTMELNKTGAGALRLSNSNNFTGKTLVSNSEFINNGTLANSEVIIHGFSKLGGKGIFGNNVTVGVHTQVNPGNSAGQAACLTFGKSFTEKGKVNFTFDFIVSNGIVTGHDTIVINETWTMSGKSTFTINLLNGTLPVGNYTIMRTPGTVSADISKIQVLGIPSDVSYFLDKSGSDIILRVEAPTALTWKGNVDGKWDTGKTANWLAAGNARTFVSNNTTLFNDEAAIKDIVINESVSPSAIVVENESNFSFSGTGSIDGTGGITKNGTGKLTISTLNSYTGKTIVNDGTIEFSSLADGGKASAIGAATNVPANIVLNGGKLNYTGATATINRGLTLESNGGSISIGNSAALLTTSGKITGTGKLIKEGFGRLALSAANDYKGGTHIKSGAILLTTDLANSSGLGTDTITLQGTLTMFDSNTTSNTSVWKLNVPAGSTGTLNVDGYSTIGGSLTGGGTLYYYTNFTENVLAADGSEFSGSINVTTDADGGNFMLGNTKGFGKSKIYLSNNVKMLYRLTANVTLPIGELNGAINSILGAGGTGAGTITWEVGARNATSSFAGKITNDQYSGTGAVAAIVKTGTGTWTLTNANTYTGGTTIKGGTLMVNNTTGSGLGTGAVNILADGTLAGTGSVSGTVVINPGGILSPGNGLGTFMVNNNVNVQNGGILAIDIDKTNAKNDLLTASGTINMNGKLQINALNASTFATGDAFKIINGAITGNVSEIIPATPGDGIEWDLSEFASAGMLKVRVATGLNELEMNARIFPNPVKNNLIIELPAQIEDVKVVINNLVGSTVYNSIYNGQDRITVNMEMLPKGIYMMQLTSGNKSFTRKIIKE